MSTQIKDLPKYIMQTALLRQKEQGNQFNLTLDLIKDRHLGNFDWFYSKEKNEVWDAIWSDKNYDKFCKFHNITLGELETDNPEYLQLIENNPVTINSVFTKQNKLLNKNFY